MAGRFFNFWATKEAVAQTVKNLRKLFPQKALWDFNVLNGILKFWNTRLFQIEYSPKDKIIHSCIIIAKNQKQVQKVH